MDDMVFGQRYRVTEKIGSGGMAEVYKAVDSVLGRTVAVKVLHAHYASDPDFVARFKQEAQAAANLSHPNIVNIYDWGSEGSTYYIVMEYVRGTDLKALVREKGPVPAAKAAEYAAQVAAALAVAHGYGIIHRDIKPANIVLAPDGGVKVMDFGIARATDSTLTQTGSVLGTAHYVSPEQAQGRALTPASDLYSLGVVLYEITTGRLPFEGDTPVAVALKHVNDEPIPPRQINPGLSPALEAIILRAMSKNPQERFTSAEEMRRELGRAASGRVVAAADNGMDRTSVMPPVAAGHTGSSVATSSRVRPVKAHAPIWPWAVLVLLLLAIALFALWSLGVFGAREVNGGQVVVPDLVGMTAAEAADALDAVDLVVGDTGQEYSDEPTGTVLSQNPGSGSALEPNSPVAIVLSQGREQFPIPDLVDMAESEALAALRSAGFELNTIQREFNTEITEGNVISQSPAPGSTAPAGTAITLVVSRGTELKRVPDVVGQTQDEARSALEAEGFKVAVNEEFNAEVEAGRVISQNPDGGVSVDAGSEIEILVSQGIEQVAVPKVLDMTEEEAVAALEELGFDVVVNYQLAPEGVGIVLAQDPTHNSKVQAGSTVTIWVGQAPEEPQ